MTFIFLWNDTLVDSSHTVRIRIGVSLDSQSLGLERGSKLKVYIWIILED